MASKLSFRIDNNEPVAYTKVNVEFTINTHTHSHNHFSFKKNTRQQTIWHTVAQAIANKAMYLRDC